MGGATREQWERLRQQADGQIAKVNAANTKGPTDLIQFPTIITERVPSATVASAVRLTDLVGIPVLVGRTAEGANAIIIIEVGSKVMRLSESQWYKWHAQASTHGDPFVRLANKIKEALR